MTPPVQPPTDKPLLRISEVMRLARHRCGRRPDQQPCAAHIEQARTELIEEASREAPGRPCERCGATADHDTETCCSSHEKRLCHACYRRTHFVEVCHCGRPECDERERAREETYV